MVVWIWLIFPPRLARCLAALQHCSMMGTRCADTQQHCSLQLCIAALLVCGNMLMVLLFVASSPDLDHTFVDI